MELKLFGKKEFESRFPFIIYIPGLQILPATK